MKRAILLLVLATACGGSQKTQPDDPQSGGGAGNPSGVEGSGGAVTGDTADNMLSPDKMDEAERALNRKSMIMSQCLAEAMEAGAVKRGSHGKVALEITVDNGKASSVKVIKSDFQVDSINDCVIRHVKEVEFPVMKKTYETSHTYAMEAN